MSSTRSILLTAAAAFAGGFAAAVYYQSPSAQRIRGSVASSAKVQSQWLEQRLAALENQIHHLEGQLQQVGSDFGQRFKDTVGPKKGHDQAQPLDLDVDNKEVERELRRIPRS
jgi:predicted metal-dependent hydrolase